MTTFDLTPLWRSTVGFERLFDLVDKGLFDDEQKYPPYDIVRTGEDRFRITLALAGWQPEDVTVTEHQNVLTVAGQRNGAARADEGRDYLYRGIASRAFERRFTLSDYVVVKGATFDNGMLHIDLERQVPEAMKPRRVEIGRQGTTLAAPPGKAAKLEHVRAA
ncbi:MAG: Hsp20 family protein [Bauldia sp.]